MVKYKTILSIIETEIEKCNDGTSFTRALTNSLNNWADKNRKQDHEIMAFYDKEGNLIFEEDNGDENGVVMSDEDFEKIFEKEGYNNLDLTHNHPSLHIDNIPTYLSTTDRDMLLVRNSKGEYCFRSMSAETPNGYRVTIVKNNNFSEDNHFDYEDTFNLYNLHCKDYHNAYKEIQNDYAREKFYEYKKQGKKFSGEELRKESIEYTLKKLGSLDKYLRERGVFDNFKKANCKLRIVKN